MDNKGKEVNANPNPVNPFTVLAMKMMHAAKISTVVSNIDHKNTRPAYMVSQGKSQ